MEKSGIWPKLEDFFGDFLVKIQDMSFFFVKLSFFVQMLQPDVAD